MLPVDSAAGSTIEAANETLVFLGAGAAFDGNGTAERPQIASRPRSRGGRQRPSTAAAYNSIGGSADTYPTVTSIHVSTAAGGYTSLDVSNAVWRTSSLPASRLDRPAWFTSGTDASTTGSHSWAKKDTVLDQQTIEASLRFLEAGQREMASIAAADLQARMAVANGQRRDDWAPGASSGSRRPSLTSVGNSRPVLKQLQASGHDFDAGMNTRIDVATADGSRPGSRSRQRRDSGVAFGRGNYSDIIKPVEHSPSAPADVSRNQATGTASSSAASRFRRPSSSERRGASRRTSATERSAVLESSPSRSQRPPSPAAGKDLILMWRPMDEVRTARSRSRASRTSPYDGPRRSIYATGNADNDGAADAAANVQVRHQYDAKGFLRNYSEWVGSASDSSAASERDAHSSSMPSAQAAQPCVRAPAPTSEYGPASSPLFRSTAARTRPAPLNRLRSTRPKHGTLGDASTPVASAPLAIVAHDADAAGRPLGSDAVDDDLYELPAAAKIVIQRPAEPRRTTPVVVIQISAAGSVDTTSLPSAVSSSIAAASHLDADRPVLGSASPSGKPNGRRSSTVSIEAAMRAAALAHVPASTNAAAGASRENDDDHHWRSALVTASTVTCTVSAPPYVPDMSAAESSQHQLRDLSAPAIDSGAGGRHPSLRHMDSDSHASAGAASGAASSSVMDAFCKLSTGSTAGGEVTVFQEEEDATDQFMTARAATNAQHGSRRQLLFRVPSLIQPARASDGADNEGTFAVAASISVPSAAASSLSASSSNSGSFLDTDPTGAMTTCKADFKLDFETAAAGGAADSRPNITQNAAPDIDDLVNAGDAVAYAAEKTNEDASTSDRLFAGELASSAVAPDATRAEQNEIPCSQCLGTTTGDDADELGSSTAHTSLHLAAYHGHVACLEEMITDPAAWAHAVDHAGRTPLFYAAARNQVRAAALFADLQPDWIDAGDAYGDTPVHVACARGAVEVLQLLLQYGASPTLSNSRGMTGAHLATALQCVQMLHDYDGNLCTIDRDGRTPLFIACAMGREDVVLFLIELDAERYRACGAAAAGLARISALSMADANGDSPLHAAAGNGRLHIVQMLLEYGADVVAENAAGYTAEDVARLNRHVKCCELLRAVRQHEQRLGGRGDVHQRPTRRLLDAIGNADIDAASAAELQRQQQQRSIPRGDGAGRDRRVTMQPARSFLLDQLRGVAPLQSILAQPFPSAAVSEPAPQATLEIDAARSNGTLSSRQAPEHADGGSTNDSSGDAAGTATEIDRPVSAGSRARLAQKSRSQRRVMPRRSITEPLAHASDFDGTAAVHSSFSTTNGRGASTFCSSLRELGLASRSLSKSANASDRKSHAAGSEQQGRAPYLQVSAPRVELGMSIAPLPMEDNLNGAAAGDVQFSIGIGAGSSYRSSHQPRIRNIRGDQHHDGDHGRSQPDQQPLLQQRSLAHVIPLMMRISEAIGLTSRARQPPRS